MNGGFLCKVSLAHLAFLRCGNICTKVLGNWLPGSSPARGTGAGQASLSTADTSRRTRKVSVLANSGNKARSLPPKLASLPSSNKIWAHIYPSKPGFQLYLRGEYDIDITMQVRGAPPSHSLWWLGAFAYWWPVGQRWKHHSHSQS